MGKLKYVLIAFVVALVGCATGPTFETSVNSLSRPNASAKRTYFLIPGVKGVKSNDLQFQKYASQVRRVLNANGYVKSNSKNADLAIILAYGIGNPETHHYTYSLPTYGQTGVSSSSTYGTVSRYGNNATYSGTTTYTPSYGITGSVPVSGSYTTYYRYADLVAFDWHKYVKTDKKLMLWKTSITSVGSSGDLRRVFPILIAAGAPYIVKDTGQEISVGMHEGDKSVGAVKGTLKNASGELIKYMDTRSSRQQVAAVDRPKRWRALGTLRASRSGGN